MKEKNRPAQVKGNGAMAGGRVDYSTGACCFALFGIPLVLAILGGVM